MPKWVIMKNNPATHQDIPETYITDPGLAKEMAYAEKPHQELARVAMDLGLHDDASDQRVKALTAGLEAGHKYLQTERDKLDSSEAQLRADTDTDTDTDTDSSNKPETNQSDIISLLSPEQAEKAKKLTAVMAEKFGVSEANFSLLATETEAGEKQFTLAYSAGNGIHKGSWNTIMNKKSTKDFTVELDGQTLDTRTGMTKTVYNSMVEQAKLSNQILPDSPKLEKENNQPWISTTTLFTGEQTRGRYTVQAARVNDDGSVYDYWISHDADYKGVRFRPAVVIK